MKKLSIFLLLLISMFTFVGCNNNEQPAPTGSGKYYVLPDLNGKTKEEIIEIFERDEQNYSIEVFDEENELYENQFIMYQNYDTGDTVDKANEVIIVVYPEYTGERAYIRLPNIEGLNEDQIIDIFDQYNLSISFSETTPLVAEDEGLFAYYGSGYEAGDLFYLSSSVPVVMYEISYVESIYYFPVEMDYDGPLLSDIYETIDPIDPRGGYFEVDLYYCSDGDTAVFDYPTEIYNLITSGAKSTRFLNMDTEETYSGGEEEWGKSGSVYTCDLLNSAESIILQTDPGDALTGTYGRLLAWVWIKLPGEEEYFLLNYMVVKQGLAQVKYEFGAGLDLSYGDHTYNEWMHIAEDYAKAHELGQWGDLLDYYWDYENDQPYYERW